MSIARIAQQAGPGNDDKKGIGGNFHVYLFLKSNLECLMSKVQELIVIGCSLLVVREFEFIS